MRLMDNDLRLGNPSLGVAATSPYGILAAQNEYLSDCQPAFFRMTLDALAAEATCWLAQAGTDRLASPQVPSNTVFVSYLLS